MDGGDGGTSKGKYLIPLDGILKNGQEEGLVFQGRCWKGSGRSQGETTAPCVPAAPDRGNAAPRPRSHFLSRECLLFPPLGPFCFILPKSTQTFSLEPFLASQRRADHPLPWLTAVTSIAKSELLVITLFLALIFLGILDGRGLSFTRPCSPRAKKGASHMVPAQQMLTLNSNEKDEWLKQQEHLNFKS